MPTCCGNFQRQPRRMLPFHILQIQRAAVFRLPDWALRPRQRFHPIQMRRHRVQAACAVNFNVRHHGNLFRIGFGQNKHAPRLLPLPRHRQRPTNRA